MQPMALQLTIERTPADAQESGRDCLVPVHFIERFDDVLAFDHLQWHGDIAPWRQA